MPSSSRSSGDELFEALRSLRTDVNDLQKDNINVEESVGSSIRDGSPLIGVAETSSIIGRGPKSNVASKRAYILAPSNLLRTPSGMGYNPWVINEGRVASDEVIQRNYEPPYLREESGWAYCFTIRVTTASNFATVNISLTFDITEATTIQAEAWMYFTAGRATIRLRQNNDQYGSFALTTNRAQRVSASRNVSAGRCTYNIIWSQIPRGGGTYDLHVAAPRVEAGSSLGDHTRYLKLGASLL